MKMNVKLSGTNSMLDKVSLAPFAKQVTMVFGADVTVRFISSIRRRIIADFFDRSILRLDRMLLRSPLLLDLSTLRSRPTEPPSRFKNVRSSFLFIFLTTDMMR